VHFLLLLKGDENLLELYAVGDVVFSLLEFFRPTEDRILAVRRVTDTIM
jgi:hypothetical protein